MYARYARLTFAIAANEDVTSTLVRLLKNLNILNKKYPSTGYFFEKIEKRVSRVLESTDLPIAWSCSQQYKFS